ncbi:MAG: hypothetical protein U0V72_04940 [Cytophagales bacterium]
MIFLKKIYDVKHFAISNDYIGVIKIHDKFILECLGVEEIDISYPEISRSVYSYHNYMVFSDIKNICSVVIDLKYKKEFKLNYLISFPFLIDNFVFNNYLFPNIRTKIKESAKIKIPSFEIESVYPINYGVNGIWKIIDDRKFISIDEGRIFIHSFFDGKLLWQHSFPELLESEQGDDFIFQNGNIVVHDGKLYFSLFERNRHLNNVTVCIDIETGKIEKKYKGFAGNLTLFNNKIAIAGDKVVEILDLKTHSIYKKDYSNYLGSDKLSISWNSFKVTEDELFYFIASDHRQGSYIGIIDLKTDELIWLYALNPDKETYDIGALDFKLSDNRMYVHCSDNTLHIFEKE